MSHRSSAESDDELVDPLEAAEHQVVEIIERELHFASLDGEAREQYRHELQIRLGAYVKKGRARVVITDNTTTMLTVKRGQGITTFRVHHMFIDAPASVLRALVGYAERQDAEASRLLKQFIDVNEVKIRRADRAREFVIDVEGRHHNLQQLFDDLNASHFGGGIRARIT